MNNNNGVIIDDTFAEAFPMKATRLLVTAHTLEWARHAALAATGFATSVIGCGCEAGIEAEVAPSAHPTAGPALRCCCSRCRARSSPSRSSVASASAC